MLTFVVLKNKKVKQLKLSIMKTKLYLTWTRQQAKELATAKASELNATIKVGVCDLAAEWEWATPDCTWANPGSISGETPAYIVEKGAVRHGYAWQATSEDDCEEIALNYLAAQLAKKLEIREGDARLLVDNAFEINEKHIGDEYCDDNQMQYLYDEVILPSISTKVDYIDEHPEILRQIDFPEVFRDNEGNRHYTATYGEYIIVSL